MHCPMHCHIHCCCCSSSFSFSFFSSTNTICSPPSSTIALTNPSYTVAFTVVLPLGSADATGMVTKFGFRHIERCCDPDNELGTPGQQTLPTDLPGWARRLHKWRKEVCLFTAYPLPSLRIHCVFTVFSLPIHYLFTSYSLPIHCLFTAYSLPIHCLFTAYSLPIHCLFTAYSLPIH